MYLHRVSDHQCRGATPPPSVLGGAALNSMTAQKKFVTESQQIHHRFTDTGFLKVTNTEFPATLTIPESPTHYIIGIPHHINTSKLFHVISDFLLDSLHRFTTLLPPI